MYNLIIAFAVGVVVTAGVRLAGFPLLAGVIPGVLAFVGTYVLLARRIAKRLEALVNTAKKELESISSPRDRDAKISKAVKTLEQGLQYDKWQPMVASQVHGPIGIHHYRRKDYAAAEPHLAQASKRDGMSQAMRGALYYQRKDYPKMTEAFERAVKAAKKESVIWAAYGWCLQQSKERDKAIAVLGRAVAANPNDEKLKASLTQLQNDKKMKMKAYEPMWWQFGLEQPPPELAGGRRVQFQRR